MHRMATMIAAASLAAACCDGLPAPLSDASGVAATLERQFEGEAPGRQAVFSRDGGLLASSSASGRITLRRTKDWRTVAELDHPGGATSLVFGLDRGRLYSGGYDGKVRVWDLAGRRQAASLSGAEGTIWTLDLSPDGTRLAAAGEDRVIRIHRLDAPASPIALGGHERNVWEVRFSPDGRNLASGSFDATARIWDVATGRPVRTLAGHSEAVVGLAFSPDGRTLATGGDDSAIRLWSTGDGRLLRTLAAGNHVYKMAFSPDGRWLATTGRARSGLGTLWHRLTGAGGAATPLHLWRVSDGALALALPNPEDVTSVAFTPDGSRLVTGGEDGVVRVWRLDAAIRRGRRGPG